MRLLLALLLVAAVARAATLQVGHAPIEMLHAERVELTERFELVRIEMAKALVGSTRLDAIEISEAMTPAGTPVSRGHWTYVVTLQEAAPDAAPEGAFDVTLSVPGARERVVRLVQDVSDPLLPEGARVSFDLGWELPEQPLFVLTLVEVDTGPIFELTSGVDGDLQYVWTMDGEENPTIHAAADEEVTFTITNGDGTVPHNLRVLDGSDPPPTSENVDELGETATLEWTPPAPGSYVYECRYHPTMSGIIEVD